MSGYQNAGWLSRLISIAKPGEPANEYVTNVNLVNDGSVRSSREQAPFGRIIGVSPAPAAGEFAGWELRADDNLRSPLTLLHGLRAFASGPASIIAFLSQPTATFIADRTAASFSFRDNDPDVSLSVFSLSTAGGDLPASPMVLPPDIGVTAGWAAIVPFGDALPFAAQWIDGESLYIWAFAANVAISIDATIQGVRR